MEPGRPLVRVTPLGGAAIETSAWCVNRRRAIDEGVNYPVNLETPADAPELGGPTAQEAAWLIAHSDGLIAAAASPGLEAAAIQVAVWQLTGQAADTGSPTDDDGLNARVAELRALAAGQSPVTSIALSGPGGTLVAGLPATVTVTGTPGGQVDLGVEPGASLSATSVTLDPAGRALVVVTPPAAGPVVLTARAEGGLLWRATPPGRRVGSAGHGLRHLGPGERHDDADRRRRGPCADAVREGPRRAAARRAPRRASCAAARSRTR